MSNDPGDAIRGEPRMETFTTARSFSRTVAESIADEGYFTRRRTKYFRAHSFRSDVTRRGCC